MRKEKKEEKKKREQINEQITQALYVLFEIFVA